jgi:hypothetical protein
LLFNYSYKKGPFSVRWRDLKDFSLDAEENETVNSSKPKWHQPFPYEVPHFPIEQSSSVDQPDLINLVEPTANKFAGDTFIPDHLPAYPHPHTYQHQLMKKKRTIEETETGFHSNNSLTAGNIAGASKLRKIDVVQSAKRAAMEASMSLEHLTYFQSSSSSSSSSQQQQQQQQSSKIS